MNVLARVLGGLALLLLVLLGVGIALPGRWEVEATGELTAPPDSVSSVLSQVESWRTWMPWPESGARFRGPAYGAGASFRWDDPTYGSGRFTVLEVIPGRSVRYRVRVEEGSVVVHGRIRLEALDGGTRIRWSENGQVGWNPLLGLSTLTMDDRQRAQLENALAGLRRYLGSEPDRP